MTMDKIERLSAYMDGALDAEDAQRLEAELAINPDLTRELSDLKASDDALKSAFAAPMNEPMPDRFMALLGDAEEEAAPASAQVIDFAAARDKREQANPQPRWLNWQVGSAIAASLVVALFATNQLSGPSSGSQSAQQIAFNTALDKTPSGKAARLGEGRTLAPRLSFSTKDGRFCREFADGADLGIACRGTNGWTIEALEKGAAGAGSGEEGYATASGEGGRLDPAYARLGAGDPLDQAAEAALITRSWSPQR
jgi:negative regulator of sigma E activity